jgi:DNA polymerase-3 subunit delta'
MRKVVSESFIKPNDADIKIYIFEHFEDTEAASQNVLLKVIEDPPEGVRFMFTAGVKSAFLPTILSRAVTIAVPETTEAETINALRDTGKYSEDEIIKAAGCFPGNIGKCIDFADGGKIAEERAHCVKIIDAVITADEYALLSALNAIGENRAVSREVIAMTVKVIRDAAMIATADDAKLIGCYKEGAAALAAQLTKRRAADLYEKFEKTAENLAGNVNVALTYSALAARLHA